MGLSLFFADTLIFNKMHSVDYLVLFLYVIILIIFGLYKTGSQSKNSENYLLAGRRLSLPGFVVTLVSTWYGGILGIGENTYSYGLQTWVIFGIPYYFFALIFAFFIAGQINSLNTISLPDHFHNYYGKKAGIISALFILILASPAPYILSIGILLQFTTGIPFGLSLILSTIISMSYIWFGGFKSVVKTDFLQFFFMFTGFFTLLIFSIKILGDVPLMLKSLPPLSLSLTGGASFKYILIWFFIALWTFVDPSFYQRCAAAKTPKTARNGIIISIIFWFLFDVLTLITGLYAKANLSNISPLLAFPELGAMVLPPFAYGIFIIGLLSVIMSSIDSLGFISATTFGRDILWRIQSESNQKSKNISVNLIRKGLIVTSFISIGLAFSVPSIVNLWYTIGSIIVPGLILPFLLSFKTKKIAIIPMMLLPVFSGTVWMLIGNILGSFPLSIEPFYIGIMMSLFIYGVSLKNG